MRPADVKGLSAIEYLAFIRVMDAEIREMNRLERKRKRR